MSVAVRKSSGAGNSFTNLRNSMFPAASIRYTSTMTSSPPATTVVARPSTWANRDGMAGPGAVCIGGGAGGGGGGVRAAGGGAAGGMVAGGPQVPPGNMYEGAPVMRQSVPPGALIRG